MYCISNILLYCNAQAGVVSGICLTVNCWALKKKGPVLVSMFSPIGTVCSVIFSVVTLGHTTNIGRYFHNILATYVHFFFSMFHMISQVQYLIVEYTVLQLSRYVPDVHWALLCALGQRERRLL